MLSNEKPMIPLDACYFLTLNTVDKIDVFTRPAYKQVIAEALNYFITTQGLTIYSWCLMTSHLHLIVRTKEATAPAYFERDFKKYTTPAILKTIEMEMDFRREWMLQHFEEYRKSLRKEKFHLWQDCCSPLRIDCSSRQSLLDRIAHIHENPVRERIVEQPESYLFSSARDYTARPGLVRVRVVQQQGPFGVKLLSSN
ncbi:transposase [Puia dinghuensis]|uniref:Transposase n=1 Tax=Puia dinghuensis TaxID=1792502 RepID=A0A8J2UFP0_9BACT|nr:transposase [Puia dinghuensis]GGB11209.1 transposase [Puia dinghuensis]